MASQEIVVVPKSRNFDFVAIPPNFVELEGPMENLYEYFRLSVT